MRIKDPLRNYLAVLVAGVVLGAWGPGWLSSAFSPSWGQPSGPSSAELVDLAEAEFQTAVQLELERVAAGRRLTEVQYLNLRSRIEQQMRGQR